MKTLKRYLLTVVITFLAHVIMGHRISLYMLAGSAMNAVFWYAMFEGFARIWRRLNLRICLRKTLNGYLLTIPILFIYFCIRFLTDFSENVPFLSIGHFCLTLFASAVGSILIYPIFLGIDRIYRRLILSK